MEAIEAINDSLKYTAQARELLIQHLNGEETDILLPIVHLLDKIIETLTSV